MDEAVWAAITQIRHIKEDDLKVLKFFSCKHGLTCKHGPGLQSSDFYFELTVMECC